jgi:hypothetical protein
MSVCAVCQSSTGLVVNIIMADVSIDAAPEGCFLVPVEEDIFVSLAYVWDGTQFLHPSNIESLVLVTSQPNEQA